MAASNDPAEVADRLVAAASTAGVDAVNLRVHIPGIAPATVREQIERIAGSVVPRIRNTNYRDTNRS
jgi:hypothetical protein